MMSNDLWDTEGDNRVWQVQWLVEFRPLMALSQRADSWTLGCRSWSNRSPRSIKEELINTHLCWPPYLRWDL